MTDTDDGAAPEGEAEAAAAPAPKTRKARRTRGFLATIGVVLTCVLLLTTCLGVWARRSFLKTDIFVARAGNLIDDPGVQNALAGYLSDQLNMLIDPQAIFEEALPDRAQILAVPLAGAVENFVDDKVHQFVSSDTFANLWKDAIEVAHRQAVRVLLGDTQLLDEQGDRIVVNLLPVIDAVLAQIGEQSPEIFGHTVNIPTVTVDDLPDDARTAIGNALGITLDDNFGTFTIYDNGALSSAQKIVKFADKAVWVLIVLLPLFLIGTLVISARRRRTLLQLMVGFAVTMVLLRRFVFLFQDELLDLVRIDRNRPAVDAASDAFLSPMLTGALWIGIGALVIAVIAALTGPYGWAVRLRRTVVEGVTDLRTAVVDRGHDPETQQWAKQNLDKLRIAGGVVGVVLLWWLDVSWFGFFLLAGLLVAYELIVSRLAERASAEPPA